jgi:hypothetical protein
MGETFGPPTPIFLIIQEEAVKTGRSMPEIAVEMAKTHEERDSYLIWATKARNPNAGLGSSDWANVVREVVAKISSDDSFLKFQDWARAAKGLPLLEDPPRPVKVLRR